MIIAMSRPRLMQVLAFAAVVLLVVLDVIPWYSWIAFAAFVAVQIAWEERHATR